MHKWLLPWAEIEIDCISKDTIICKHLHYYRFSTIYRIVKYLRQRLGNAQTLMESDNLKELENTQ